MSNSNFYAASKDIRRIIDALDTDGHHAYVTFAAICNHEAKPEIIGLSGFIGATDKNEMCDLVKSTIDTGLKEDFKLFSAAIILAIAENPELFKSIKRQMGTLELASTLKDLINQQGKKPKKAA